MTDTHCRVGMTDTHWEGMTDTHWGMDNRPHTGVGMTDTHCRVGMTDTHFARDGKHKLGYG